MPEICMVTVIVKGYVYCWKTIHAVSTGVLCCNLAESMSALKMCIFSKHCHEVAGFLLWTGTYSISCVVEQRSRMKDLPSLVWYDESCLAAIRHVKSVVCVVQPRPNIRSHSVLFNFIQLELLRLKNVWRRAISKVSKITSSAHRVVWRAQDSRPLP